MIYSLLLSSFSSGAFLESDVGDDVSETIIIQLIDVIDVNWKDRPVPRIRLKDV